MLLSNNNPSNCLSLKIVGSHNESHITTVYEQTVKSPLAFLTDCASGLFSYFTFYIMQELLSKNEAMEFTDITIYNIRNSSKFVIKKDFNRLIRDRKELTLVLNQVRDNMKGNRCGALQYYINNIVAFEGVPLWIGSFACDFCYWVGNDYMDVSKDTIGALVGFILNELFYYDYIGKDGEVMDIDFSNFDEDLFINRIKKWFRLPYWLDKDEDKNILSKYI